MSPDERERLFGREGSTSTFGESLDPKRLGSPGDVRDGPGLLGRSRCLLLGARQLVLLVEAGTRGSCAQQGEDEEHDGAQERYEGDEEPCAAAIDVMEPPPGQGKRGDEDPCCVDQEYHADRARQREGAAGSERREYVDGA